MVHIVGAPFDLCGRRLGSRLGPVSMRLEGLVPGLERLGHSVTDTGSVSDLDSYSTTDLDQRHAKANRVYAALRDQVKDSIGQGATPIVIGGDHSVAIGSVAGALAHYGEGLGVLWIDAHMDLNTPEVSPSGNLHGMPLAALTGLTSSMKGALGDEWTELDAIVGDQKLDAGRLTWLGLRDVDRGEVQNFKRLGRALALTMQDVDALGVAGSLARILDHHRKAGTKALWVSFDVDSLDPIYAPGTGTAVRGGLTYREGHLLAESLCSILSPADAPFKLAGLDVVEVNPLVDTHNETAAVAVEWTLSLFGKSILHAEDPGRTER